MNRCWFRGSANIVAAGPSVLSAIEELEQARIAPSSC